MGALHEGHVTLVREALRHGDDVTVSIFVNPTQFGPSEDFDEYPRTLQEDVRRLEAIDAELTVFAPSVAEVYPDGPAANATWVEVEGLDEHLCGRFRAGHFRGVATVVTKLLLACRPHAAVFGLKDAQQFVILRRMMRDLPFGVDIVGVPTVREPDGLAFSSRNRFLSPAQREQAVVLSQAVRAAARLVEGGEQRSEAIVESMRFALARAPEASIQYAELVDAHSLKPTGTIEPGQNVLAAVAVFFGDTRLIDSAFVQAAGEPRHE